MLTHWLYPSNISTACTLQLRSSTPVALQKYGDSSQLFDQPEDAVLQVAALQNESTNPLQTPSKQHNCCILSRWRFALFDLRHKNASPGAHSVCAAA